MNEEELTQLQTEANAILQKVVDAILEVTSKKTLILFDRSIADTDESDTIMDYPWGFTVSKHGYYLQGNVQRIEGNMATLFLTGEDWGEEYAMNIEHLPIDSQIDLLSYLLN